jgi:hypothetical protein
MIALIAACWKYDIMFFWVIFLIIKRGLGATQSRSHSIYKFTIQSRWPANHYRYLKVIITVDIIK